MKTASHGARWQAMYASLLRHSIGDVDLSSDDTPVHVLQSRSQSILPPVHSAQCFRVPSLIYTCNPLGKSPHLLNNLVMMASSVPSFNKLSTDQRTIDDDEEHEWDLITAAESREAEHATARHTPETPEQTRLPRPPWPSKKLHFMLNISIGHRECRHFVERAATSPVSQPNVHPQPQCPLFALPAELRLNIYSLVLGLPRRRSSTGVTAQ